MQGMETTDHGPIGDLLGQCISVTFYAEIGSCFAGSTICKRMRTVKMNN